MTFSTQWEKLYSAGEHLSIWPWSDLVSHVMRFARPSSPDYRVLELGMGAGANVPLFAHLDTYYTGVDGSPTIVAQLSERFRAQNKVSFQVCDFTRELPGTGEFDLIFDRGAVSANDEAGVRRCLELVKARLRPGGAFIGIDWYSVKDGDAASGKPHTRTEVTAGKFAGTGKIQFFDEARIRELFDGFAFLSLSHKTVEFSVPEVQRHASYNFVCRK